MIFLVFKVAVSVQTVHPIYFILNARSISLEKILLRRWNNRGPADIRPKIVIYE